MRRDARRNYAVGIRHIGEALIACGYAKLDQQARALGIHRAGVDYRKQETQTRPLIHQDPASVRAVVEKYMAERSDALARRQRLRRHNAYIDPFNSSKEN